MASTSSKAGRALPPKSAGRLAKAKGLLARQHGSIRWPGPTDPFELLLWEYVAYLTDDADRAAAFAALKKQVGTTPDEIAGAPAVVLESVCRTGGAIAFKLRAQRMHAVAIRVRDRFEGDLSPVLALPYPEARRVLKSFPAIGPPGADKILLLAGAYPVLALDSNALRVLLRFGYGEEPKSYQATYASAQKAAMAELPGRIPSLRKASLLLRRHGQSLCKRNEPLCHACSLRALCPFPKVK